VFTARYVLSPYIKQIRFVFKGLNSFRKQSWRLYKFRLFTSGHVSINTEILNMQNSEFLGTYI
jgi:hypothetical protein